MPGHADGFASAARRPYARAEAITHMAEHTAILTANAPAPVGPYSQAIRSGGFIFCSGQVGLDPVSGKIVEGGVGAQARQVLDNLAAVLASAGLTFEAIVKTTIFLVDINDFAAVNAVYGERMGTPPPARSTIAVAALPLGALVEIEAIAQV
jgi:2-iminobutanoate/2-iminopropanoate deaminase